MISVLIPVKNAAEWLPECLQSLQAQSFTSWEAILMNDHSEDNSVEVINAFQDPRIRVYPVKGKGIVGALNEGLLQCRFPFIARMDADDIMPPTRLEVQAEWLQQHPETGLVSGQVELFSKGFDSRGYQRYVDWINTITTPGDILRYRFVESPMAHPSVMFRQDLIQQYGGYREGDFPEDYELWLRWLDAGVRMEKVSEKVLAWRDHTGRLSRRAGRYSQEAFQFVRAKYLARWLHFTGRKQVWYWGDGRIARSQRRLLEAEGIQTLGIVEVNPDRSAAGVQYYKALGAPQNRFLVSLVGNVGARREIESFLIDKGWIPEQDFILAG